MDDGSLMPEKDISAGEYKNILQKIEKLFIDAGHDPYFVIFLNNKETLMMMGTIKVNETVQQDIVHIMSKSIEHDKSSVH